MRNQEDTNSNRETRRTTKLASSNPLQLQSKLQNLLLLGSKSRSIPSGGMSFHCISSTSLLFSESIEHMNLLSPWRLMFVSTTLFVISLLL